MSYLQKIKIVYGNTKKKILINVLILNLINTCLEVFNIALLLPLFSVILNKTFELQRLNILPNFFFNLNYYEQIISTIIVIIIVYIIKVYFFVFGNYYLSSQVYLIGADIGDRLVKKYLLSPLSYHIYNSSSTLIRNVYKEVNELIDNNIRPLFYLVNDCLVLFAILFFLLLVDLNKFLILIFFSFFIILLFYFLRKFFIRYGSKRQFYDETRLKHLQNLLKSIREIKIYQREEFFLEKFSYDNRKNYEYAAKNLFLSSLPRVIIETIVLVLTVFSLLFLLESNNGIKNIDIGTYALFLAAIVRFIPLISKINTSINSLRYGLPTLNVLSDEISKNNQLITRTDNSSNDHIFIKSLEFKNVSFAYDLKKKFILDKLNFKISKGDLVKIIGKSGSGKTTLTNLIIGFLEPTNGEILLDNVFIKGNHNKWISKIGIVSQSIFLLNDTIENNIVFGSLIDKHRLKNVLNAVNLTKEDGFKSSNFIGENGSNLSGGEIQRIAIARALYNDSDLIIFDEPTSNLDNDNTKLIESLIKSLKKTKTIIVITHDKNLFQDSEVVINLN
ncbi:ABC transporter ATP-binding protein/permease [Candidatus Pelagibacter ubique]|nr:ABC transporter ATP-binding protein/permease [Candidatus Pelagibacter ubique]